MTFTAQHVKRLSSPLPQQAIKSRSVEGFEMRYIEGWFAINEANRIFGYDGWCRENLSLSCVFAKPSGNSFMVSYLCKVRIRINSAVPELFRDGTGFGSAQATTLAQAHEQAAKSAETDATKRALVTFGKRFGLQLYASRQEPLPKINQERP